jgi:hypothetical protein
MRWQLFSSTDDMDAFPPAKENAARSAALPAIRR